MYKRQELSFVSFSLFASHMFENLTCPLGPYDKNVTCNNQSGMELYENIELPIIAYQEDPYGGDNCKCDCHNVDDPSVKINSDHCISCGTRVRVSSDTFNYIYIDLFILCFSA